MPVPDLGILVAGDAIEITFRGRLFGQRILNEFHYELHENPPVVDRWPALAAIFDHIELAGGLIEKFLTPLSTAYMLEAVRIQFRLPERMLYREFSVMTPGSTDEVCATANMAVSVSRRTVRTTRKGRGRVQLAGIPAEDIVEGLVTDDAMTNLVQFAQMLDDDMTVTGGGLWHPVLWTERPNGQTPINLEYVVDSSVQRTARVMRRRTVGVGE